jgi:hypothetical protein
MRDNSSIDFFVLDLHARYQENTQPIRAATRIE